MKRLAAAQHRRHRLQRDAHHVVVGLLRGQRRARRLRVEAQRPGARVARAEALFHDPRPEAAGGAEFRHFLDEIVVDVEEEAEPSGKGIDVEPAFHRRIDVSDSVSQGEGDLLRGGAARLADVIAADGDGVPFGNDSGAIVESIGDQPHRGRGRIDIGAARHVFLQDVVLDGAGELGGLRPVRLPHGLVEGEQRRRRRVDGHRSGDLAQVDAVEEPLHVVDGIDSHAYAPHFAPRPRAVGVVAHLRG